MESILNGTRSKMEKMIEGFEKNLASIRTGRANTTLVDGIEVEYYGTLTPINQIGSISVVEGRQIVIKPYDMTLLKEIEKAIFASDIGITPQNDGTVIRISVPALNEERRKEYCKVVTKHGEEAKVLIRNVRRDGNELAKKDDTLTEDLEKSCLEKIQKMTDEFIKKIDLLADEKIKEIMKV